MDKKMTAIIKLGVLTLIICFVARGDAGRPPKILEHPVDSVVPRNEPVTLNCKAEGDPPPEVVWLKDGKLLRSSEARQVRVYLPSGSLFFLRVRKDLDTGVYECIAQNSYGEARSRNATLDVATLRDEFRTAPQNTWVAQGDTATMECEPPKGNPEPKVLWKKNGQVIDMKANGRYRVLGSGSLSISQVRQTDEGRYMCVAKNIVGIRQSTAALLRVTVRPQFTIVPANTSALLGSDVSLACVARGDPPPEITWKKQNGDLPLKRAHFDEERFLISNVSETDVGVYLCVAENKAGSIVSSATVSVLAPPVLTVIPQNIEIQPNTTAFIGCQAEGEPQPTLFWSKEGSHSIVFQGSSNGNVKVTPEGTLQIDNISERDEGDYICAAVSSTGSVMHKVDLKVTRIEDLPPPIITLGPTNQTRPIGSVAIMPCVAHGGGGFPVPVLTWYKDSNSFQLNHRIFTDDAGTLRINDLETSDSGMYECVASSRSGKYVWRSFLHVEHPSNPHAVFRRTGFEMASQRPKEPMKPFVVKIEATSVTIAWHTRFLHFTDDEDDQHQHRTGSGEESRRGIISNEDFQNKKESKSSSNGKIEFGSIDQPPPPFQYYNQHQHPSYSLPGPGSNTPKRSRNGYDDDDDNEDGMVDDDPKTQSLIEKSAFVAENDYYKGKIRNKRFSYTKDDMSSASGDILSDTAGWERIETNDGGNGKRRNRSQLKPSEPVLQLQPVDSNFHQDKSSQLSNSNNGKEKVREERDGEIEAEHDNQSQKINNFNPFENDRNHDNGNEESDEKSRKSWNTNEDGEDADADDIIREDDTDDEEEDYKEERTQFQESIREAKYIEQESVKIDSDADAEEKRKQDGDDDDIEVGNKPGTNNLIISSANAIPRQKLSSSSNYKNADYFESVVTSTETPLSSLTFSALDNKNSSPIGSSHPNQITYKVEYYSAAESKTEWLLGATNVPIEMFTLHYLKPNTQYIFFVRAVNSADGLVSPPSPLSDPVITSKMGTSKYSLKDLNAARAKLDSTIVVLLKHAYPTSSTSIRIEWQLVNAGDFVEGYLIYYRPLQNNDDGSYQMLTVLNTGATTFQITTLDKFATYQIFVVPFYKNIEGRPSNYINVTTAQDVPSVAPELLDPVPVNSSAIVVRWKAIPSKYQNGVVLGYQLRVWTGSALVGNMTTNGSTLSLLLNNLVGGRQYSLQVACFTSKGVGPFSSMKTVHFRPEVLNNNENNNINVYNGGDRFSGSKSNSEGGASSGNGGGRRHKDKSLDGNNVNFGGSNNNMENTIFDDSNEEFDQEGLIRSTNHHSRHNYDGELLSEVWFIALIGSLIFFMLLVFVAVLYLRRCQLRHGSDKLKVSTTEIPDGSMPPRYPDDNTLWIDSPHQQSKQLSLKSVKTSNNDMMNEYENGNNYAVVEERLSPIAYATTTLVNGEKHKSHFSMFGDPIKGMLSLNGNGHGPAYQHHRPTDFGMSSASPKILGWTSSATGVTAAPIIPGNNKTGSLNICSQDMKKPSWFTLMSAEQSLSELTSSPHSKNSPKYSRSSHIERTPSNMSKLSRVRWQRSQSHSDSPSNRKLMTKERDDYGDGDGSHAADGDDDPHPELGKGTSLNVLTTFQTPLPSRKHLIVDYTNGQSVNSMREYHEPRLSTYSSISNNNSNHNGYTNHNAF